MQRVEENSLLRQPFVCEDTGFEKDEPVDVVVRPEDIEIRPFKEGEKENDLKIRLPQESILKGKR